MRCVSTFTSVLGNLRSSTTDNYILFLSYSLASDCWTLLSELGGFRRRCSDPPSLKRRRTETSLSLYIFKHIRTSTLYTSVLCTIYIYIWSRTVHYQVFLVLLLRFSCVRKHLEYRNEEYVHVTEKRKQSILFLHHIFE